MTLVVAGIYDESGKMVSFSKAHLTLNKKGDMSIIAEFERVEGEKPIVELVFWNPEVSGRIPVIPSVIPNGNDVIVTSSGFRT